MTQKEQRGIVYTMSSKEIRRIEYERAVINIGKLMPDLINAIDHLANTMERMAEQPSREILIARKFIEERIESI